MKGGSYKLLRGLRFWRANVRDDGAIAVADLLALASPTTCSLTTLQMLDDKVGPRGCAALSAAAEKCPSLLALLLDYNDTIGDEGIAALVPGVRLSASLERLSLDFCGITNLGAFALRDLLLSPTTKVADLSLQGNLLGGSGLALLAVGLVRNHALKSLNLADNGIGSDEAPLRAFADALKKNNGLVAINFEFNMVGERGELLLPALDGHPTIREFIADGSIPEAIFEKLSRVDAGGGGGGGKKKGKKK
jgi:hypothetical protein